MHRRYIISLLTTAILIGTPFAYANLAVINPVYGITPTPRCKHGWPFTYLTRQTLETDPTIVNAIQYRWPVPSVPNEERELNLLFLLLNCAIAIMVIGLVSTMAAQLMDRNQKTQPRIET